jgi:hypothetical protein
MNTDMICDPTPSDQIFGFQLRILKDELLYSWLSRYQQSLGPITSAPLMRSIVGATRLSGTAALLYGVGPVIRRLYTGASGTSEIINAHTALPYFSSFADKDRITLLRNAIEAKWGGGGGNSNFRFTPVAMPGELRYCPQCRDSELKIIGQATWNRVFQMPGVFYCYLHETKLFKSSFSASNPRMLIPCPSDDSLSAPIISPLSPERAIALSKLTFRFMNHPVAVESMLSLRNSIRAVLLRAGWLHRSGHVRAHLWEKFTGFHGHEALLSLGCGNNYSNTSWIHDMVGRHTVAHHPLRYLLLFDFLGPGVNSQYGNKIENDEDVYSFRDSQRTRAQAPLSRPSPQELSYYRRGILADKKSGLSRADIQSKHARRFRDMMAFDQSWLNRNLPRPPAVRRGYKDTSSDDAKFRIRALDAIKKLATPPDGSLPRRLTVFSISIEAKLGSFPIRQDRYPQTSSLINECAQTVDDYRLIVLEWTAKGCRDSNEKINFKMFCKLAKFHPERHPIIRNQARRIHQEIVLGTSNEK